MNWTNPSNEKHELEIYIVNSSLNSHNNPIPPQNNVVYIIKLFDLIRTFQHEAIVITTFQFLRSRTTPLWILTRSLGSLLVVLSERSNLLKLSSTYRLEELNAGRTCRHNFCTFYILNCTRPFAAVTTGFTLTGCRQVCCGGNLVHFTIYWSWIFIFVGHFRCWDRYGLFKRNSRLYHVKDNIWTSGRLYRSNKW